MHLGRALGARSRSLLASRCRQVCALCTLSTRQLQPLHATAPHLPSAPYAPTVPVVPCAPPLLLLRAGSATAASDVAICVAPFSDEQWEALEALSAAARHIRMQPCRLGLQPGAPAQQRQQQKQKEQQQQPMRQRTGGPPACPGLLSLRAAERREPCRVAAQEKKRALWHGALWWPPNDACSIFGPPGAGKCMVVVVNGLLSNGRLPHAYYYKWPALWRGRPIRAGVRARGSPMRSRPLSRLHA